jgi:pyruvate kinase
MEYAVIATLGPSSQEETAWSAMLDAGVSAFRLNTSHLSLAGLAQWLERLAAFLSSRGTYIPLYLDLQGSKWRLGEMPAVDLVPGEIVRFEFAESSTLSGILPVPHADFFRAASLSTPRVSLNDGKVLLELVEVLGNRLSAQVIQPGRISSRKGITYTQSAFRSEILGQKDLDILRNTRSLPFVRYAISYVRDGEEMFNYRKQAGNQVFLAAKIERQPAVDDASHFANAADEAWLCRGDLGAEMGLFGLAKAVYHFSEGISGMGIPALIAGGLFEHMVTHPQPARSEVCFLHDALLAGYHGLVLSDETAVGSYPLESCQAAAMFRNL